MVKFGFIHIASLFKSLFSSINELKQQFFLSIFQIFSDTKNVEGLEKIRIVFFEI
jgi:hypothetical protein